MTSLEAAYRNPNYSDPDGRPGAAASWLRFSEGAEAAPLRLVCFAHAGAGASSFNGWPRLLPPYIGLVKVQLPGREDNLVAPPFTTMAALLPPLLQQVAPLLNRPFALYGHSMGALVAFELFRALRARGLRLPLALFVSGRRAPHKPLRRVLLHRLPHAAFVEHLRKMGGTSVALLEKPKWLERYLPIMRADLELSDIYAYREEPPLACPLHAFLGETDDEMDREDWEAWAEQAAGEFSRALVPGGHILSGAGQALLVSKIVAILAKIQDPTK